MDCLKILITVLSNRILICSNNVGIYYFERLMANKYVTPPIGIHLGKTFSCVGVWYQRHNRIVIIPSHVGDRTMPSFVAFTPNECLIGEDAKNQVTRNAANTIYDAQRLVGRRFDDPEVQEGIKGWPFKVIKGSDGLPKIVVAYKGEEKEYSPEEITSMVLAELKKYAELYLSTTVKDAVITVPASLNDSQRQATKFAANLAGLDVVQIIREPSAAAIAYGLDNGTDEKNVIFHLDDDTFDVSLVTVNNGTLVVKAMCGDNHFSGQDIVNIMVDHFVKEFKLRHKKDLSGNLKALGKLRIVSKKAIQDLSSNPVTSISVDFLHEGIDFDIKFTRSKFEYINRTFFNKCIETVASCLRAAKMNKTDVDDIVLVGATVLATKTRDVKSEKEKSLRLLDIEEKGLRLLDIVPLSLGVDAHDGVFSVIIPRNTPIPAEKENIYFTTSDNQNSISFNVYQGDRSRAKDNNWLGKFEAAVSPAPKGKSKVSGL